MTTRIKILVVILEVNVRTKAFLTLMNSLEKFQIEF